VIKLNFMVTSPPNPAGESITFLSDIDKRTFLEPEIADSASKGSHISAN